MKTNNLIAIIPARGGSKGIIGKNLVKIAGKPLIAYTIEAALKSSSVEKVYVTTDDEKIAKTAESYGAKTINRPKEISGDKASSEAALIHALETIEKKETTLPEFFVFLQCTSPLTLPEDIDGTINLLLTQKADTALSATSFHGFVWKRDVNGDATGVNHDKNIRLLRQDKEPELLENGAVYVMNTNGFLQKKHRFFGKTAIYEMPLERAGEIDDPADLKIMAHKIREQKRERLVNFIRKKNIKALVMDFDGVFTDNKVRVDQNGKESVYCSRGDGMGISLLQSKTPIKAIVISKEQNKVVRARCEKLKLECVHGVDDKLPLLTNWCDTNNIQLSEIMFVGNDINDLECLKAVGISAVVADAHPSILDAAHIVLKQNGGNGAIREVCDAFLELFK